MKVKTFAQVSDSLNKTSPDILKQMQAMTDDIRGILQGGLSFADKQLPFEYIQVNVTSGQPTIVRMQTPFRIIGCYPVFTNGATILGFKTTTVNGNFAVTLTLDITTSSIGFLTVGTIL